jgi:hypothetical protein
MADTDYDVIMDDSSTFDDSQFEETSESSEVETDFTDQSEGQADIQDGSQGEQNIPYDRFSEVNERLKAAEAREQRLIELLGRNPSQAPAQNQQEPEIDIIDKIVGEDLFVTRDQMKEILKYQKQHTDQVLQSTTQSSREQNLIQTETAFRQANADYDSVIANIPPKLIQSLYMAYDSPAELVQAAYNVGKSFAPQKPTAASVVKQAGQNTQALPKAVVANEIKGGGAGNKSVDQYLDENFNRW